MAVVFLHSTRHQEKVIYFPFIMFVLQPKSYTQICKDLWNPWNLKSKEGTTSSKIM